MPCKVKKWQQDIRAQNRGIERQIRSIEREEAKVKASIKQVAKRGDTKSCKSLAKELVRSRKHKDRLYTSKAQLNSVSMQLTHQLGKELLNRCVSWKGGDSDFFNLYYQLHLRSQELYKRVLKL